jgi:hypothetical protein
MRAVTRRSGANCWPCWKTSKENVWGSAGCRESAALEATPGLIRSAADASNARLVVLATGGTGRVDLDMVSLFPKTPGKKRPNGLRADLVQQLRDMRPGFMRFPGGCIVEGFDLANAYRWKDTIGDIATRPQNWNRWQSATPGSPASQYYQTYGLGFFEYFQLCEDIGRNPCRPQLRHGLPVSNRPDRAAQRTRGPWVQDALDLIEFANGPGDEHLGRQARRDGPPQAVWHEVPGRRQRAVGAKDTSSATKSSRRPSGQVPRNQDHHHVRPPGG